MKIKTTTAEKGAFFEMFSVASVLFGWHAGGGFATGNQANQFYVVSGLMGIVSAALAMQLLSLTVRQAMVMYNSRGLQNYKQLLETLFHPYDKMELLFEIFYYIMVLMATSSSIAGAGELLKSAIGLNYYVAVAFVGVILLALTIFGADLVRKASSAMSVLILLCALTIFLFGIKTKADVIGDIFRGGWNLSATPKAIGKAFQYAGFQCACIPTMIGCCSVLSGKKECAKSMWISFAMNTLALCLSVLMLLGWKDVYLSVQGGATIPTLTICREMGITPLVWAYNICLFLCLISTGVGAVFGVINRFGELPALTKRISNQSTRRLCLALLVIAAAVFVSLAGLTNIIKYGYSYCGYLGIAVVVIPFLTVGVIKNHRFQSGNQG